MEGVLTEAEQDFCYLNWQLAIRPDHSRYQPVWPYRTTIRRAAEWVQTRLTSGGTMPPGEKRAQ